MPTHRTIPTIEVSIPSADSTIMHQPQRAKTIFCTALEFSPGTERRAYLDRSCGTDRSLRQEVEGLLSAHREGIHLEPRPTVPPLLEQPGTRLGTYTLKRLIGEGGMGVVYLAEQREPVVRDVALKILKPGMDTHSVIQRFEGERQALAVMDHPNVAKVLDAGATESGRPYFVMELVCGTALHEFCDQRRLDLRARIEVFVDVCHGVHHAHQKGIIHRDLKPANVLVSEYDGHATPKIIDFGVAKATDSTLPGPTMHTKEGQILGTPEYMSPEQASLDSIDVDTRSDIYSLGVFLYELLTGTTPVRYDASSGAGITELLRLVREVDPPRPSQRAASLGANAARIATNRGLREGELSRRLCHELDWIIMQALDKDRNRRYESAGALAADLERYLRDEPVLVSPPSRGYRIKKFVRRNRRSVVAVSIIMVLLVLGLTGTSLGFVQAMNSNERERKQRFNLALDRGLALCTDGKVSAGVLWLARALSLCPTDAPDLERLVRSNLRAWSAELNGLVMMYPHRDAVISVAISHDGKLLATGSNDHTAQLWDLKTGEKIGPAMVHRGDVHELEFSADGKLLLSSDYHTTSFLWEVATGVRQKTFQHGAHDGHDPSETPCGEACGAGQVVARCGGVAGAAFRPGPSQQFVTSCGDGSVRLWHSQRGLRLAKIGEGEHGGFVHDVAFSADGRRMLTACHDKKTRIWDLSSRTILASIQHQTRVPTADFLDAEGQRVVTGDGDGNIYGWSVARAAQQPDRVLREADGEYLFGPLRHDGVVHRIRADASGSRFLSASYDNTASLWTVEEFGVTRRHIEQRAAVQGGSFQPGGPLVAIGCDDNAARLVRPAPGQVVTRRRHPFHENQGAVFTADGKYVLLGPTEGQVVVAETMGARRLPPIDYSWQATSLAVSADRSVVAIGTAKNTCQIFDAATGRPRSRPLELESGIWSLAISPDSELLLAGSYAGSVHIYSTQNGRLVGQPMQRVARIHGLAFSPRGDRFAVASADKMVRIFARNGTGEIALRGHRSAAVAVCFSPDGTLLASAGHDKTLRVWNAQSGATVGRPMSLLGPIWFGTNVAFSPDGELLVTGSDNRYAQVWDVRTGRPLGPPLRHASGIRMAAFMEDGRVVTGTTVGRVNAWRIDRTARTGTVNRIRLWAEVETGMRLDVDGVAQPLDLEEWKERRLALAGISDG